MFILLLIIGAVIFFAMRGRQDRPEQLGASRRALPTGPLEPHTFPCPYPKCPTCGASGDKMQQVWDGLRSVKWSCEYLQHPCRRADPQGRRAATFRPASPGA